MFPTSLEGGDQAGEGNHGFCLMIEEEVAMLLQSKRKGGRREGAAGIAQCLLEGVRLRLGC